MSKGKSKSLAVAILGNLVEFYDYTLYGLLASELSRHFFPPGAKSWGLLQVFAVFALGSVAKPLGAFIFSKIGDAKGRKLALRWNMLGIAVPTFLMGIIPSYAQWGIISTFLLILCRIIQGILVGGEADGVRIYILEHVGKKRYCFAGSLVNMTSYFGISGASFLSGLILSPSFPEGSWRYLFMLGGVLGLIVFLLRRYLHETEPYLRAAKKNTPSLSFLKLIKQNKKLLLSFILITGSGGAVYPFIVIFMNSFLSDVLPLLTPGEGARYASYAIISYTLCSPIGGYITDYLPKVPMVVIGKILLLFCTIYLAYQVWIGTVTASVFFLIGITQGLFSAPIYPIMMEKTRIKERYRSLSIAHTIGSMLLANTTPWICMLLWRQTHLTLMPLIYFSFLITLTWVGVALLPKAPIEPQ